MQQFCNDKDAPGGVWEGGGGCLAYTPHPKIISIYPPSKKILGQKWEFGQKMSFVGNFLTNPRDFNKSAVKFTPPPPPRFLAVIMYGWSSGFGRSNLKNIYFWFCFSKVPTAQKVLRQPHICTLGVGRAVEKFWKTH